MLVKKIITSVFLMVLMVCIPVMLLLEFVSLRTLLPVNYIDYVLLLGALLSVIFFFFTVSGRIADSCFSKKGLIERRGWLWVALAIGLGVFYKTISVSTVESSGYFLLHREANPELPSSYAPYAFSASDDKVCFVLKSGGKRNRAVYSRKCYKRNEFNMNYKGGGHEAKGAKREPSANFSSSYE